MILYNTTFCVDEPYAAELIDFLKTTFIPAAYDSGLYHALLTRVRAPREQNGLNGNYTVSYALQLRVPTDEICHKFVDDVLPRIFFNMGHNLQQSLHVYCTELDVIHDHDRDGDSR